MDEDPLVASGEAVGEAVHRLAQVQQRSADPLGGPLVVRVVDAEGEVQVGKRVRVAAGQRAADDQPCRRRVLLAESEQALQ